MKYRRSRRQSVKYLLAAGTFVALAGMLINPRDLLGAKAPDDPCQSAVKSKVTLSRDRLAQLLTVSEGDRKDKVRSILKEPYCTLAIEVRSGVKSDREAYPLAFDPQTWLIVLYEGNEYRGYAFSFRKS
ncbi:hypothetical protein [Phormidesmis priestleyi]|uniref:hypothetical protein n=1 Tax=Phormidesmis priestleyi TaxID=268141 RepID=UPI00083A5D0E|nr:hypothetical protein [Phormidesmis priestleyi]